jgi:mono/diheme cytochrome c family protein
MKSCTILSLCLASLVALPAAAAGNVASGQKLYQDFCQSCHGEKGEGNPKAYKKVKATKIVHLGSDEAQDKTDDFIRKTVTQGWEKMEKVDDLETPQQVEDVLAFVRTLRLNKKATGK